LHRFDGGRGCESDGINVFVVYNGVRIAKRGQPNSPQADTWVSLEPGFRVCDKAPQEINRGFFILI
jgi:hypothetical protein